MTPSAFMLFDPLICGGETKKKMAIQVAKKCICWSWWRPPRLELDMMSAGIRGCSEKSTSFKALIWGLELNEKIFSPDKQALNSGIRWPAVPTP
jgi:hypothetical protein